MKFSEVFPIRQHDAHGSGAYLARRGKTRKHKGIDYAAWPKTKICSHVFGTVTKLGYCYGDDLTYRYVQITDDNDIDFRFFYLNPLVKPDDKVKAGTIIGEVQDLRDRYEGITPHFHFEVKKDGMHLDPRDFL